MSTKERGEGIIKTVDMIIVNKWFGENFKIDFKVFLMDEVSHDMELSFL